MAAIRSKNTKPELALRAALRDKGVTGYRVHKADLPGRPDIAFTRWKVAVFVDGVFWHGHPDHWNPATASSDYWRQKIAGNIERDRLADEELTRRGWRVIRIWDVDIRNDLEDSVNRVLTALKSVGRTTPTQRPPPFDQRRMKQSPQEHRRFQQAFPIGSRGQGRGSGPGQQRGLKYGTVRPRTSSSDTLCPAISLATVSRTHEATGSRRRDHRAGSA
ncbi:very short patch repair endonuclease [Gordonia sp. C13]|nr:very short patch repair endonuclease [Gordonia sp. C13]